MSQDSPNPFSTLAQLTEEFEQLRKRLVEAEQKAEGARFFVLIIPDQVGSPVLNDVETPEEAATILREASATGGWGFVFVGKRWGITRPPFRMLVSPDGNAKVAIDEQPNALIDPTGSFGPALPPSTLAFPNKAIG